MTERFFDPRLQELQRQLESGAHVASIPVVRGGTGVLSDLRIGRFSIVWEDPRSLAGDTAPVPVAVVGQGAAAVVSAPGAPAAETDRFETTAREIAQTLEQLQVEPRLRPWVRFFGGSAFATGRDGSGCWADFGEATFVLPRILYVDRPEGGLLIAIAKTFSGDPVTREELLDLCGKCLAVLSAPRLDADEASRAHATDTVLVLERKTSAGRATFGQLVDVARQKISAGVVSKVVAARRVTLTLSAPPHLSSVLARLAKDAPTCTRFAFRIGERVFLGATPELLLSRRGAELRTEALAGTIALDPERPELSAQVLLGSEKDRAEHGYVAQAIEQALSPICQNISRPAEPQVRRLAHLAHLWTPIQARLTRPEPVLSLVRRLHPTPAVGGLPRQAALDFITAHEAAERGWYASPVGFVDAAGDGDFFVALRSALIHRDRVHLFAGAGIVAGSDPNAEFDETELKLGAMQRALGIA